MEAKAHIKHVRISPIKLRLLVDSVKEYDPQTALDYLSVSQNRTAKVLYKAIKSAIDNGVKNHGMDSKNMRFGELMINEGRALRRFRAGARGMGKPYLRRSSHILVRVEQDLPAMPKKSKKTETKKTDVKKSEPKKAESKEVEPKKATAKTETKKTDTEKKVTSKKKKS